MSRVLPRRSRSGAGRRRDPRAGHRRATPAFTETDDEQPTAPPVPRADRAEAADAADRADGAGAPRPGRAPSSAPAAPAPPARPEPVAVLGDVEATPAADTDLPVLSAATELSAPRAGGPSPRARLLLALGWSTVVLLGVACLVLALLDAGPGVLDGVGATAVLGAFTWALAARTGGRPVVCGSAAVLAAVAVLVLDLPSLRTGAAVMTCSISAVLALVLTVPAPTWWAVVRECSLAVSVAAVGALATVGFAPTVSLVRFEYVTLALALLGAFAVVHQLGAGFHGLGRRGVVLVTVGGVVLLATLLYAELLRRYGPAGAVDDLLGVVRWGREHLGAFPRPLEAVLGVPAMAWGVHLRARRRQGWWVCAFGAAGTAAVASTLVNPAASLLEGGLSVLYGLVAGLALGWLVIRVDLALAGTSAGGRRSDDQAAARPEPPRSASLI